MNSDEVRHSQELLAELKRRKGQRELQLAKFGVSADPVIVIEIEDLSRQIEQLEQKLKGYRAPSISAGSPAPKRIPIFQILGFAVSIVACIAAVIVVPEVRRPLGLDGPASVSTQQTVLPAAEPTSAATQISLQSTPNPAPTQIALEAAPLAEATPAGVDTAIPSQSANGQASQAQITVHQAIQAEPATFLVTLDSVQLQPTNTMRWTFDFWNKTPNAADLLFNTLSYVVDDLGNRYAIVKDLQIHPQAGERVTESVDFEAPKPGAKVLTLYWGGAPGVRFQNPVISVAATLNAEPTAPATPTPVDAIAVNQAIQVEPTAFLVTLVSVQVEPTNTMRWTFDFWNKTPNAADVFVNTQSYVVDDLGNRYAVVKELHVHPQAGERMTESVDFEAPKPDAKVLTFYWGGAPGVHFPKPAIDIAFHRSQTP